MNQTPAGPPRVDDENPVSSVRLYPQKLKPGALLPAFWLILRVLSLDWFEKAPWRKTNKGPIRGQLHPSVPLLPFSHLPLHRHHIQPQSWRHTGPCGPAPARTRARDCSSYQPGLFTQMVASFIIFVRGVVEVGKEEDWLNLQRLFISWRRDGGREHWVRKRPACYTFSAFPPPDHSTPPLAVTSSSIQRLLHIYYPVW